MRSSTAGPGSSSELLGVFREQGVEVRGTERAIEAAGDGVLRLDRRLGFEWANDPERVATVTLDVVDDLDEAMRLANEETWASRPAS